jgi:uncharacterized membrane protein YraQ (UPF0718 family)
MSDTKRGHSPANKQARGRKGRTGWWFLLGVVLLYLSIALFDVEYAHNSLQHFLKMGRDLLPVLILVFLFLWIFNLSSDMKERLIRLSGNDSGIKGWVVAVTGGILSHGPVYPWYPLLQELKAHGVRPALIAAFLYARSIKLPWLPLMAHYFGLSYMIILTLYMGLFSIANGWLLEKMTGSAR